MYIKQLDIDNFKSFNRKTSISFDSGFTVISGPNGSGKSNIIDCILFILTLSGSRILRAERLPDLINLNSGRNYAEASLTFSDGTIIKRRIKQGTSNYYTYLYLNGKPCKQGELLDFLAGRGIVPHGYNVVMQGDINRIIEMSDFERRRIIDEIAGVAEFDTKKALSYEELGTVRERIQTETIYLDELSARLQKLEKERSQALKYRELLDESKKLTIFRSAALIVSKTSEINALKEGTEKDNSEVKKLDDDISWAVHERDFVKEDITRIDKEISSRTGSEYMTLVSKIAEAKAAIDGFERSIENTNKEKDDNNVHLSQVFASSKKQEERLSEKDTYIRNLMVDRTGLSMTVATVTKERDRIKKEIDEKGRLLQEDEDNLRLLREKVSDFKDKRGDLIREQDMHIERSRIRSAEESRLSSLMFTLNSEILAKKQKSEETIKALETITYQKTEFDRNINSVDIDLYSKREALEILQKQIRDLRQDIIRKEAQQQAQGKYSRAIEAVLSMEGVYGTIADLAKCSPEYATALNVAAGGRLSFVVVEDDKVASDAIDYLKEHKLGRVTFLPLNKLKPKPLPTLPRGDDVIGFARELLSYDPEYDSAFRIVFGSTIVVDTLASARRRIGEIRMVTLDGSLVEKSGSMTGGSNRQGISGFGQNSEDELKVLSVRLSGLMAEERSISDALTTLSESRESISKDRGLIDNEIVRLRTLQDSIAEALLLQESEYNSVKDQINAGKDGTPTSNDLALIENKISDLNKDISACVGRIDEISTRIDGTGIPELFDSMDRIVLQVEESERRLKNKETDIFESQRERAFIQKQIEQYQEDMGRINGFNERLSEEIVRMNDGITAKKQEIADVSAEVEKMTEEISDLQEERSRQSEKEESLDLNVRELMGKKDRIILRIETLEEKISLLSGEIEMLKQEACNETTDLSVEEIDNRLKGIATAVESLGAVNMRAIEDYEQVEVQANARQGKLEVLQRELKEISERIEMFSRKKLEAFMEAYNSIDKNFSEIFAKLTMGTGELCLENYDDPFSGGLSFTVQPRDKNVHHLAALSGGEKSLTTLAFIFSLQSYIPAPFYAFDEVDMNLDGANVERIADMIKSLSMSSQFISISLRKPMIEVADHIVGVTIRPDKSTLVTGVSVDD